MRASRGSPSAHRTGEPPLTHRPREREVLVEVAGRPCEAAGARSAVDGAVQRPLARVPVGRAAGRTLGPAWEADGACRREDEVSAAVEKTNGLVTVDEQARRPVRERVVLHGDGCRAEGGERAGPAQRGGIAPGAARLVG